jgi:hypothetical protein
VISLFSARLLGTLPPTFIFSVSSHADPKFKLFVLPLNE